jgi:tetratricopeptide (TPR) repeat protein
MPVQEDPRTDVTNYVRLFVELHRLVASGAGDSDQADELRDQMDRPWYKLSDAEMRMTDILAVNLYDFDGGRYGKVPDEQLLIDIHLFNIAGLEEAPEARAARQELDRRLSRLDAVQEERQRGLLADLRSIGVNREVVAAESKQAAQDCEAAIKHHEWDLALTILREHENEVLPAEVAAMRGFLWAQLGNDEIAALFFGEAVRQKPTNMEMLSCYLRSLIRCGHFDDARRKARFIVNKDADPLTLLLAADVLFDCLDFDGGSVAPSDLRLITELVNREMKNVGTIQANSWRAAIVSSALFSKALSHELLGETSDAVAAATQAEKLITLPSDIAEPARMTDGKTEGNGRLREQWQEGRRILHQAIEKPDTSLCAA